VVDPLDALPSADRDRIRGALAHAQSQTSAKFELVTVHASDHYVLVPVAWAAVLALVATGALALLRPNFGIGLGFAVNAGLFVVLCLIFDWWPIRVRLVPENIKRVALYSAAHRAYAAHGMSKDDEDNGVMLFVSLAERHLEIVAERKADAAVPPGTWDRIVREATEAMRTKGLGRGLTAALDACGSELKRAFPA
jgi:putative membrane protein